MTVIEKGFTTLTKVEYELVMNGRYGYLVRLYMPRFPKSAPFIFYGNLKKCRDFIEVR